MVDKNKLYFTNAGHEVRIYATDCGGTYSVHGAVLVDEGEWLAIAWTDYGEINFDDGPDEYDLKELGA